MPFAVLVVGSPGAGKSTFCHGIQQLYSQLNRKCTLINLDPANDALPYECDFDVRTIVDFEQVCTNEGIGPNGAFLRCMEIVESKIDILREELKRFDQDSFYIFDCPGQVELYSMHNSILNIIKELNEFSFSVANILDATHLHNLDSFLAITMITLNSMLHLELPQVNFLNKLDLVNSLPSPIEAYCLADLHTLIEDQKVDKKNGKSGKFGKLTQTIIDFLEEHSLVSYVPIAVEDKDSMLFAMGELDRISGYVFGALSTGNDTLTEAAYSADHFPNYLAVMQERYLSSQENK